ncbi:MAG: tetratricopeptide repeat protein, partial [bacterium]
ALCNLHIKIENIDAAEACLKEATAASPKSSELWYQYGALLMKSGKTGQAKEAFIKVKKLNPKFKDADLYIGMAAYQNGDIATARAIFKGLYAAGKAGPDILAALGSIAAKQEDYKEAEMYFQKALDRSPSDMTLLSNLVICKMKLNKTEEAVKILDAAVKKNKKNPKILSILVSLYIQTEKYAEARDILEELVKKEPGNAEHLRLLAALRSQIAEPEEAIDTWRSYLKRKPDDTESRENLAKLLERAGKKDEALKEYERIIAKNPKNEKAHEKAGLLSEDLKMYDKAEDVYAKMATLFPDSAVPPSKLGIIAEKKGDTAAAESYFSAALGKKKGGEYYVYIHLAKIRETQGKLLEAELLYRQGLERLLDHSQQVFIDFMKMQQEGRLDLMKIIEISEQEKGLDAELDAALAGVHNAFTARSDTRAEEEYFLGLLDKYKENKKIGLFTAGLMKERGEIDRVLDISETILKSDVKDDDAHMLMGWAYDAKGDMEEAGKAYKRAVEADTSNEAAWHALADNYRRQDKLPAILEYAEGKYAAAPDSAVIKKIIDELKGEPPPAEKAQ